MEDGELYAWLGCDLLKTRRSHQFPVYLGPVRDSERLVEVHKDARIDERYTLVVRVDDHGLLKVVGLLPKESNWVTADITNRTMRELATFGSYVSYSVNVEDIHSYAVSRVENLLTWLKYGYDPHVQEHYRATYQTASIEYTAISQ